MKTEKSLSERFVDLIQVPHDLDNSFEGDLTADLADQYKPVKGSIQAYLPMAFELMPPTIPFDADGALAQNTSLERAQLDVNFVGENLVSSNGFFETMDDFDLTLQALDFMEPLTLYVNPSDLTRAKAKAVQEQFGGQGHIVEFSGDLQDTLSCNGKIGATYTSQTGVTRYFRRNSASYQQLMQLYIFYRNNGYLYEVLDARRISLVGAIKITYGVETWIGQFDSFTMTENADNPYTMEYSFEFTAREYY